MDKFSGYRVLFHGLITLWFGHYSDATLIQDTKPVIQISTKSVIQVSVQIPLCINIFIFVCNPKTGDPQQTQFHTTIFFK